MEVKEVKGVKEFGCVSESEEEDKEPDGWTGSQVSLLRSSPQPEWGMMTSPPRGGEDDSSSSPPCGLRRSSPPHLGTLHSFHPHAQHQNPPCSLQPITLHTRQIRLLCYMKHYMFV